MHHTKDKGDLAVLKAKLDLLKQGWISANPETEHAPFDIIIWKDGVCKTVQVKHATLAKSGTVDIRLRTSWADKNGTHSKLYKKELIDLFCVFCPNTDECYYFNVNSVKNKVQISLRISTAKNKQKTNIKMASDYRKVP